MEKNKIALYEPTLFLRDGKEWIKGFTMERPIEPYEQGEGIKQQYERALDDFLMSAVEYPVCEGSKKDVRSFLSDKYTNAPWCWSESYIGHEIKVRGMRIDDLADRLEVFEIGVLHREKQIRLRPEVKGENPKLYTKDQVEQLCRSAFEAGRSYQMGEYSEYHGGHEHDYPNKENWIKNNIK